MGKGFQNFMSKKDFHPSAWWNLKKVWEARQKKEQQETRDAEMQVQYEKEQEIFNNKALLGDEKAKMGLSFMYEAPAGMHKREEDKPEPKFEWQRKYNAPRESWAQNNEAIVDHPFGIAVRNVRCVRCHTWGHVNTDSECPLYGKSGNYEEEGYANNPSDLVKELRKAEKAGKTVDKNEYRGRKKKEVVEGEEEEWVPADSGTLAEQMREEHGMKLKANMLSSVKEFEQLEQMGNVVKEKQDQTKNMLDFFNSMSKKDQEKVMRKTLGLSKEEKDSKKKSKKDKKKKKLEKKMKRKLKKMKVKKEEPSSDEEEDKGKDKNGRGRRDSSVSPPHKRTRRDSDAVEKRKIKEEPLSSGDEREQRKKNGSPIRKRRQSRSPQRSPVRSAVRRRKDSRSPVRSPRRRNSPIREKRREEKDEKNDRNRSPRRRRDSRSPVRRQRTRSPVERRGEGRRRDSRTPERKKSPVARRRDSRSPDRKRLPARRRDSRTPEKKETHHFVADKKIKEEPISEDEYERKKDEVVKENGRRKSRSKSNDSSSSSSSSSSGSSSDSDSSDDEKKSDKKVTSEHEYRGKFAKGGESKKSPEKERRRKDESESPRRRRSPSPRRRRSRSPRRR